MAKNPVYETLNEINCILNGKVHSDTNLVLSLSAAEFTKYKCITTVLYEVESILSKRRQNYLFQMIRNIVCN